MNLEDYEHKKAGRGYKVKVTCQSCGEELWQPWNVVKDGRGKYCNSTCYNEHRHQTEELGNYEQRRSKSRHIEVKIICEWCGEDTWVKWVRRKQGLGRFCNKQCANKSTNKNRREVYGKENAHFIWDEKRKTWYAYWRDEDGTQRNTTKAYWLWKMNMGEVPDGCWVTYKDGNRKHCVLDNLEILSRGYITSKALMGHKVSDETKKKLSEAHTGKTLSKEHKRKISNSLYQRWGKGEFENIHCGESNPRWRGGINDGYPPEFNNKLRKEIRERDKHKCRICFIAPDRLEVHHMDGDRTHNTPDNLLTLCSPCHHKIHSENDSSDPVITAFRSALYWNQ